MNTMQSPYKRPFIFAVALHVTLFIFLFWQFVPSHDFVQRSIQPDVDIIKAVAVSQQSLDAIKAEKLKQQQEAERRQAELKRRQLEKEMAEKKAAEEKLAKAKAAEIKKQQEEARKIAEAKAAAEKVAQEKLLAEKAAQEKAAKLAAQEKALAEKAAQEKADQLAAQQKSAKELEQAQQQALQDQIAQEQHAIEAARSNARQSEIDRYLALIQLALENNWNKPPNLDPGIYSLLHVQIGPGGVVLNVSVAKSSGNTALDSSARAAVFKASPLPVPDDPDLFNAFRQITLKAGAESMSSI